MEFNFFRMTMTYGMKKQGKEWFVFNREKKPLGWKYISSDFMDYIYLPLASEYQNLTDEKLMKIQPNKSLIIFKEDKISEIYFYTPSENPPADIESWKSYCQIIHQLSKFEQAKEPNQQFEVFADEYNTFDHEEFGVKEVMGNEIYIEGYSNPEDAVRTFIASCETKAIYPNLSVQEIKRIEEYLLRTVLRKIDYSR